VTHAPTRRVPLLLACLAAPALSGLTACEAAPARSNASTRPAAQPGASAPAEPLVSSGLSATGGTTTSLDGSFVIRHDDWARLGLRWDWAASPFVSPGARVLEIVPHDNTIVVQESGGFTSVLAAPTGRLVWAAESSGSAARFIGNAFDGDTLFSSNETETFELNLRTGNLVDRYPLAFIANTRPVVAGDLVIFGNQRGELMALSREWGTLRWRYTVGGPVHADPVLVDPRTVAAVSQTGEIVFVDPVTASGKGSVKISGGVATRPISDGYRLFIASEDQSVYGFFVATSERIWRHRTSAPIRTTPLLLDDTLFVGTGSDGLIALDPNDGSVKWSAKSLGSVQPVGMVGEALLVYSGDTVSAVDPARGDIIEQARVPGLRSVVIDDPASGGTIYALTDAGQVVRFSPR
jgi:outer membrane protein assembly factor BamB